MTHFLYAIALWLAAPFIVVYHLYRSVSRGRPAAIAERFGFVPEPSVQTLSGCDVIWVHAVSVGETIAVAPLVSEMKRRWPNRKIVVSNVTETGREVAGKLPDVDLRIYFPFDYQFAAARLLRLVKPSLVIVVETEIWPNFLRAARIMGIPVVMVNGRISDRSFGRYLKLKWFFRPVLADVSAFCMQTPEDARRIADIGADVAKIHVTKNLKYDVPLSLLTDEEKSVLRTRYLIPDSTAVFTAGSTHPGEEEQVVSAYKNLCMAGWDCFLVLVPRHPERAGQVGDMLNGSGISYTLLSQLEKRQDAFKSGDAILVDTVGELTRFYSLSDMVFVGGSLVPTGGHNILEPASFGVPVIFGPHMQNFREITSLILQWQAGLQVQDREGLQTALEGLLSNSAERSATGARGVRMLEACRGATSCHMQVLSRVLEKEVRIQ